MQEWQLSDPRDCSEIEYVSGYKLKKNSPEVEFTVPLDNSKSSCPIYWYVQLYSNGSMVDGKPGFYVLIPKAIKLAVI